MVATAANLPGRTYEFSLFDAEQETYTRHDVLSFHWTGGVRVIDTGQRTSISFFVPYKRSSRFDYTNNTLVYGWTEHFLFKFYDDEGNYQHAFYYPFNKQPLSVENVLAYTGYTSPQSEELIEMDNLPDTWPAFHTLVFDDENRLWVSTFTDNPDEHKWRVFDKAGRLLATFNWPKENDLQQVGNGYAYALQRDPETGLFSVSKYRIEMK